MFDLKTGDTVLHKGVKRTVIQTRMVCGRKLLHLDNGGPSGASLKIGVVGTTETYINSLADDPLWFGTNNTPRMTITSGGNVLVGTTTDAGQKLQVNGTARATAFNSDAGSLNVAPATNTTFYTPSQSGLYMARVYLGGSATQTWCAVIIFAFVTSNILIVNQTNSVNVSTTTSGTSIQVRQVGAITYTMEWEVIRIA